VPEVTSLLARAPAKRKRVSRGEPKSTEQKDRLLSFLKLKFCTARIGTSDSHDARA